MSGSHRFRFRLRFNPPPPPTGTLSEPDVKLGSLTLIRHKMTLSHFSKGLIRPVSGGQRWMEGVKVILIHHSRLKGLCGQGMERR